MVRLAPNTPEYNRWNKADARRMQELVDIIRRGVADWNSRRGSLAGELPKLLQAPLTGLELIGIDLSNCDLRGANFEKSNLSGANFRGADLRGARFAGAYLWNADLTEANLLETVFDQASLDKAKLNNTNLLDASFQGATLKDSTLQGAFAFRTKLENSNLEGSTGLIPDNTLIRGAHIALSSDDPWSVLRRKYTGPRILMNLSIILIAVLPFVARAGFWAAVNRAQVFSAEWAARLGEAAVVNISKCLSEFCHEVPLWRVTLGMEQGGYLWIAPLILITYNAARLAITYRVSVLRDSEERTGYSPRYTILHVGIFSRVDPLPAEWRPRFAALWMRIMTSYGWIYRVDRVLRWFLLVSVIAFAVHVFTWSRLTVWLPAQ